MLAGDTLHGYGSLARKAPLARTLDLLPNILGDHDLVRRCARSEMRNIWMIYVASPALGRGEASR
jgi:hypothetical protein